MVKYHCEDVKELLYDYAEGLLPAHQKTIVAHHLKQCEECAKELAEIKQIISLLQSMPEEPLPQDFDENLHLALIAAASGVDDEAMPLNHPGSSVAAVSESTAEPVQFEVQKTAEKKALWRRAWFPRSVAAAIVLLFGMASVGYANDYFGFWNGNPEKGIQEDSAMQVAEAPSADAATEQATLKQAAPLEDAENEVDASQNNATVAKVLPAGGAISKASLPLASREGCVHECVPLLPETATLERNASVEESKLAFNSHIASNEAADKNYYWNDYDYAKLTLLVENKEDAFKAALAVSKKYEGYVCKEFYDHNKDVTLTTENCVMLDVPEQNFDAAIAALSALGDIETCYLPDDTTGKNYTYEEDGVVYRSIVVILEVKQ